MKLSQQRKTQVSMEKTIISSTVPKSESDSDDTKERDMLKSSSSVSCLSDSDYLEFEKEFELTFDKETEDALEERIANGTYVPLHATSTGSRHTVKSSELESGEILPILLRATASGRRSFGEQKIGKIVKQVINENKQTKWSVNDSGIISSTSSMLFFDLSALVTQSATANGRIGSKIRLTKLKVRLSFVIGDVTQLNRFIVFKWNVSSTSDTPTYGEIFDASITDQWEGHYLPLKPSRFKILFDKTWNMDTYHPTRYHDFTLPLNILTEFDVGVNTGRNHLYIAHVSDSAGVPHPSINFISEIHFFDQD